MEYLLDTHALIWMVEGDARLSEKAIGIIAHTENQLFVSMASFWEISIKRSLGKLNLAHTTQRILEEVNHQQIDLIYTKPSHLSELEILPFHHRDPFDRMLIAQARTASLKILTKDPAISLYDVETVW